MNNVKHEIYCHQSKHNTVNVSKSLLNVLIFRGNIRTKNKDTIGLNENINTDDLTGIHDIMFIEYTQILLLNYFWFYSIPRLDSHPIPKSYLLVILK